MKKIIPHITIALSLMTLTFFVIDKFNEYMAFMTSELSKIVFAALAVCALITSICLIRENFREEDRKERRMRHVRERSPRNREAEEDER